MVDTPDTEGSAENPKTDLEGPGAIPLSSHAAKSHHRHEGPNYHASAARRLMKVLRAIKDGALRTVDWIDRRGPLVSAIATVIIAVLTWKYVQWSQAQWNVMNDQLCEMKRQSAQIEQQTKLTRQQLVATVGAAIRLYVSGFKWDESEIPRVTLQWRNLGHGNATHLTFKDVRISEVRIPSGDEISGRPLNVLPYFSYEVVPPTPDGEQSPGRDILFTFPSADAEGFQNGKIGLRLKGSMTYGNGFGDGPEDVVVNSFCWVDIRLEQNQIQQDGSLHTGWQEMPVECDSLGNIYQSYHAQSMKVKALQKAAQH